MRGVRSVHWSGGARWRDRLGWWRLCLPHYPACCSGGRAERLAEQVGACSYVRAEVTCRRCLDIMQRDPSLGDNNERK